MQSLIIITQAMFELIKEKHYDKCKYIIKMSTENMELKRY